jgi:hypothetical protein
LTPPDPAIANPQPAGQDSTTTRDDDEPQYLFRLISNIWHIRYQKETWEDTRKGNQAIEWLAELLAKPNRTLTSANLRGDPEGKLAADAMQGDEHIADCDDAELKAIKKKQDDIEAIAADSVWTEGLEEKYAELLLRLKDRKDETFRNRPKKDHHAIATQLRNLRRKLKESMPQLAAHLEASLKLDFPGFGYYPPDPPPAWEF